jgi:1-aminocyclopropane-1-carboxylate deaminase/D-cysteine desulfhydrase-like pyridoxal-dependent ACC family enzyme
LGAAAYAMAVTELLAQIHPPELIVLSTSSGGTLAGIVAGCRLHGISTRILGISADDPSSAIVAEVRRILGGLEAARHDGRLARGCAVRRRRPLRRRRL